MSHLHGSSTKIIVTGFIAAGLPLIAAASMFAQSAITPPGSGTQADPYRVSELGHLVWMSDNVASSSDQRYTMTADIDASPTATGNQRNQRGHSTLR